MNTLNGKLLSRIVLIGALTLPSLVLGQSDPDPLRFQSEIDQFESYDLRNSFPAEAVLFVGSSSIRLWHTADAFPDITIINRGFGGAHVSDVIHYMQQTVLKYSPRAVVFYAGDNDIWDGKTSERVVDDLTRFLSAVWSSRNDTHVYFIAIKPSPSRWSVWDRMRQANSLVAELAGKEERLTYVDIASPMLAHSDRPDSSLFVSDQLHLNEKGYQLWRNVVRPLLLPYATR